MKIHREREVVDLKELETLLNMAGVHAYSPTPKSKSGHEWTEHRKRIAWRLLDSCYIYRKRG